MSKRSGDPCHRFPAVIIAAVLAMMAVLVGACGEDTAGPETGADVGDITGESGYFGDSDRFIGDKVTISSRVTDVLTPTSFELAAGDYGDETLLVISATKRNNVDVGDVIQVTGIVKGAFTYPRFANQYQLANNPEVYSAYEDEKFVVAKQIKLQTRQTTAPPTTGSGG